MNKREIVLILQNIRSLHNVGSVFRSADVFGVAKVYLCGYTGAPPRKEIGKVALGAETWVPWEKAPRTDALIRRLAKNGFQVVALETGPASASIGKFHFQNKVALIFGNEVAGVTPAALRLAAAVLSIPLLGRKESLNVSVAAGVALYVARNSRL